MSPKMKYVCSVGLEFFIYHFLLVCNSNIYPNSAPLLYTSPQNQSDLDFDLSRSLKVKSDAAVGHSIYDFLLMLILPVTYGQFQLLMTDIILQNLNDHDLSSSPKVKYDGTEAIHIYNFLLVFNGNIWLNSDILRDISLKNLSHLEINLSKSLK